MLIKQNDDGYSTECKIYGEDEKSALEGATEVLELFAGGRLAAIRYKPEADTHTDFYTGEKSYLGYTRFTFFERSGEWSEQDRSIPIPLPT